MGAGSLPGGTLETPRGSRLRGRGVLGTGSRFLTGVVDPVLGAKGSDFVMEEVVDDLLLEGNRRRALGAPIPLEDGLAGAIENPNDVVRRLRERRVALERERDRLEPLPFAQHHARRFALNAVMRGSPIRFVRSARPPLGLRL